MENFIESRKKDVDLQKVWAACLAKLITLMEEAPERMSKGKTTEFQDILSGFRLTTVEAFKTMEKEVLTAYRAICKSSYEAKNPGKIERENLTCKWIKADGAHREVVLLRKLPEDEWDVNFKEISGVSLREVHDDGEFALDKDQSKRKCTALAAKLHLSADELKGTIAPSEDEYEPEETTLAICETEMDENDEDPLAWAAASLLDDEPDVMPKRSRKDTASTVASQPKGISPMVLSRTAKPASISAALSRPSASASLPDREAAAMESARKKFDGKSVDEILEKHGYGEIKKEIAMFTACFSDDPCIHNTLRGEEMKQFTAKMSDMRKAGLAVQKLLVSLDIKVGKWKGMPEPVTKELAQRRDFLKAGTGSFSVFTTVARNNDAIKMEKAFADLRAQKYVIPISFHVLYYKEKAVDFLRFQQFSGCAKHVVEYFDAVVCDAQKFPALGADRLRELQTAVAGTALQETFGISYQNGADFTSFVAMADVFGSAPVYSDVTLNEIQAVGDAFRGEEGKEKRAGMTLISRLAADKSYVGILKGIFDHSCWAEVIESLKEGCVDVQGLVEDCRNGIEKLGGQIVTNTDKENVDELIAKLLVAYSRTDCPGARFLEVESVFCLMVLHSQKAFAHGEKVLHHTVEYLTTQVKHMSSVHVKKNVAGKRFALKDIQLRYCFDVDVAKAKMDPGTHSCLKAFEKHEEQLKTAWHIPPSFSVGLYGTYPGRFFAHLVRGHPMKGSTQQSYFLRLQVRFPPIRVEDVKNCRNSTETFFLFLFLGAFHCCFLPGLR